jgi:hypothetical protein
MRESLKVLDRGLAWVVPATSSAATASSYSASAASLACGLAPSAAWLVAARRGGRLRCRRRSILLTATFCQWCRLAPRLAAAGQSRSMPRSLFTKVSRSCSISARRFVTPFGASRRPGAVAVARRVLDWMPIRAQTPRNSPAHCAGRPVRAQSFRPRKGSPPTALYSGATPRRRTTPSDRSATDSPPARPTALAGLRRNVLDGRCHRGRPR